VNSGLWSDALKLLDQIEARAESMVLSWDYPDREPDALDLEPAGAFLEVTVLEVAPPTSYPVTTGRFLDGVALIVAGGGGGAIGAEAFTVSIGDSDHG
jgi:hypothetical protein